MHAGDGFGNCDRIPSQQHIGLSRKSRTAVFILIHGRFRSFKDL